jgi:hypothetical protein
MSTNSNGAASSAAKNNDYTFLYDALLSSHTNQEVLTTENGDESYSIEIVDESCEDEISDSL